MNPTDVAQSVLPLTSSDLSIWGLFWSAHIIVKSVMVGLLVAWRFFDLIFDPIFGLALNILYPGAGYH